MIAAMTASVSAAREPAEPSGDLGPRGSELGRPPGRRELRARARHRTGELANGARPRPRNRPHAGTDAQARHAGVGRRGSTAAGATPTAATPTAATSTIDAVASLVASVLGLTTAPKSGPPAPPAPAPAPGSEPDPALDLRAVGLDATTTEVAATSASRLSGPASDLEPPASPLERAIHDLLQRMVAPTTAAAAPPLPPPAAPPTFTTDAPTAGPAPVAGPAAVPTTPPVVADLSSHVHLVVGDGDQRIVLTVAVRGAEVHVALRGADEHATAALARNASVLDEALRHRGLSLAEMSTTDDTTDHPPPPRDAPPRHRRRTATPARRRAVPARRFPTGPIMTISALTNNTSSTTQPPTTPTNQLAATTSSFLQLFMAQLQQQDPLDPQSGSDMVAQLAQLSTVEQTAQTNQTLQSLVNVQSSSANAAMSNLVGRTCTATAGSFQIASGGGQPPALQLSATSSMAGASVVITDANGNQVAKLPVPAGTSGTVQWNGLNAQGAPVPPGTYNVSIVNNSSNASITAQWQGTVSAVQLANGSTQLQMGDVLVDPSTVASIGGTTPAISTSAITNAMKKE